MIQLSSIKHLIGSKRENSLICENVNTGNGKNTSVHFAVEMVVIIYILNGTRVYY